VAANDDAADICQAHHTLFAQKQRLTQDIHERGANLNFAPEALTNDACQRF
jgi:hypothetical protein